MWKEFKAFILRGNVLDLALAVILGGAFGKIITSLVNDVIMPPIGLLLGKVDFTNLFINLSGTAYPTLAAAKEAGAPTINYGLFINVVLDFVIVALILFLLLRALAKVQQPAAAPAAPATKTCPYCQTVIPLAATRCPACTSHLDEG